MKIAGQINNILPKLNAEINRRTIEHPKRRISRKGKMVIIFMLLFFVLEAFVVFWNPEMLIKNTAFIFLVFLLPFFLLIAFIFAVTLYEPKSAIKNMKTNVNYNILKLVLDELNKRKPKLEVEVELYEDFKQREIINAFMENAKVVKIFGKEFIRLPKKVEADLKIKKWRIVFPDNKVLSLKHKLRINSRRFKSSSGKIRNEAKVANKIIAQITKDNNILDQCSCETKTKFPEERVPVLDLREDYKKSKLLAMVNKL